MTNDNSVAGGIPMDLTQMRECLQEHHGIPVALRQQGTASVKCPHCMKIHHHGPQPGHHPAGCNDNDHEMGIVIGERHFHPNYGYTVYECRVCGEVNELIVPENMLD